MSNALRVSGPASTIIAGVAIRQDADGRYSLNDLHRAAGGEKRHQPSDWLKISQTLELAEAISNSGNSRNKPVTVEVGRYGGTFVVKEMVYAYAMWINALFHLKVIRAYDTLVQEQSMAIPQNFAQALRLAAEQQEQIEAAQLQIAVMQPQVEALHRLAEAPGAMCRREAAKHMQIRPTKFNLWLDALGWTFRETPESRTVAYQEAITRGYMKHTFASVPHRDGRERQVPEVLVTPKGLARLAYYIAKGKTP